MNDLKTHVVYSVPVIIRKTMNILVIDDKRFEHGGIFFEKILKLEVNEKQKHKYDIEVDPDSEFGIEIDIDANSFEELKHDPFNKYEKVIDLNNKKMMILNNEKEIIKIISFQTNNEIKKE